MVCFVCVTTQNLPSLNMPSQNLPAEKISTTVKSNLNINSSAPLSTKSSLNSTFENYNQSKNNFMESSYSKNSSKGSMSKNKNGFNDVYNKGKKK